MTTKEAMAFGGRTFTLALDVYGDYFLRGWRSTQHPARTTIPGQASRATEQCDQSVRLNGSPLVLCGSAGKRNAERMRKRWG